MRLYEKLTAICTNTVPRGLLSRIPFVYEDIDTPHVFLRTDALPPDQRLISSAFNW
jgi:hypothetical protein